MALGAVLFEELLTCCRGSTQGTLVSRGHSYQLIASKSLAGTELRFTLGRVTTEASLAKIDPDTGLQFDEGPGGLRFMTVSARRFFRGAMLQAFFSKVDARDLSTGEATPEAIAQSWTFLEPWIDYLFTSKHAVNLNTSAQSRWETVSQACR
jgi:hypothetical protein